MRFALAALFFSFAPPPIHAAIITIDNGLAPPTPANVIDASNTYPSDEVYVYGSTAIAIRDGGEVATQLPHPMLIGDVRAHDYSSVTMEGGIVGLRLLALDSAHIAISGGSTHIAESLYASTVSIMGGSILSYAQAAYGGTITMSSGSVSEVRAVDGSITVTGGLVTGKGLLAAAGDITMSGGALGSGSLILAAEPTGTISLIGSDFAVDGISVGFGPILASSGTLTGTLQSGNAISNFFCHRACQLRSADEFLFKGIITLVPVPEPGNPLLLGVAMLTIAQLKRHWNPPRNRFRRRVRIFGPVSALGSSQRQHTAKGVVRILPNNVLHLTRPSVARS